MSSVILRRGTETESNVGGPRTNVVALLILLAFGGAGVAATIATASPVPLIVALVFGFVLMQAPKVAQQWERGIVLRLGRYIGMRGPGLFWIVPFADHVTS